MGSEDFAYMPEAYLCAFINIGIGDTDGPLEKPALRVQPRRIDDRSQSIRAPGREKIATTFDYPTL
jgi:hypothetical protein